MKTKHLYYISLISLVLTLSGVFGIAVSADAQKVHALLICLADDLKIRASVNVSVAFSPDGKTIASGSDDRTIRFWEVSTGKLIRTLIGDRDRIFSVSFSPDGKTIASGSDDGTGRLLQLAD